MPANLRSEKEKLSTCGVFTVWVCVFSKGNIKQSERFKICVETQQIERNHFRARPAQTAFSCRRFDRAPAGRERRKRSCETISVAISVAAGRTELFLPCLRVRGVNMQALSLQHVMDGGKDFFCRCCPTCVRVRGVNTQVLSQHSA